MHRPLALASPSRAMIARCIGTLLMALLVTGCATSPDSPGTATPDPNEVLAERWGVRVESIRLSAAGYLVDFRYRVVDPQKAAALMKRGEEAYLLDEATDTRLPVPVTKVGQLRGTGTLPQADRVYTVMFNSGAGIIERGSVVSIVIGDFRAEHLVVE